MSLSAGGVPSPCNAVCRMHEATGWCLGCGRTLDEIAAWSTLDDAAKQAVWRELPARRSALGVGGARGAHEASGALASRRVKR